MEKSANYKFNLPNSANDEIADINDISDNFRIIDEKIKAEIEKKQDYFADISDDSQKRDINLTDKNGTVVGQIVVVPTEGIRYINVLTPENETDGANKKYVDDNFQSKLVSGTNIKTINNQSLLGSGNIDISGGGGTITVDDELSETSTNPVQNKIITETLNNKQDKITNKTDLRLNSVLLGNATVILSGDYNPTTGGTGYMLKIGGNATSDKVRITNIDDGVAADNAVNKKQLDAKQDKFATVTHDGSTQTVKIDDTLAITTNPNFAADQIISTKALFLAGSSTAGVRLDKTVLGNNADFDATQGYLRVRDNPLADDFAVNKKYVNDIKTELLKAINHPYTYDETTKELTLIL